jgi:hypothetical protein
MSRSRLALIALAASAALVASAGAAAASPQPHKVAAVTFVTDRPDSGNGSPDPYWADDTITRTLTITQTGGTAGAYTFTAALTDAGTFTTIKGEQAPNQGGSYAGDVIKSKVTGPMTGYADFSFTASSLPDAGFNAGIPLTENDHGAVPSDSTSTWFELAFPAGTTFSGGIGDWSWTYDATVMVTTSEKVCLAPGFCWTIPVVHAVRQQWIDGYNNGYGDLAGDGQITG